MHTYTHTHITKYNYDAVRTLAARACCLLNSVLISSVVSSSEVGGEVGGVGEIRNKRHVNTSTCNMQLAQV